MAFANNLKQAKKGGAAAISKKKLEGYQLINYIELVVVVLLCFTLYSLFSSINLQEQILYYSFYFLQNQNLQTNLLHLAGKKKENKKSDQKTLILFYEGGFLQHKILITYSITTIFMKI